MFLENIKIWMLNNFCTADKIPKIKVTSVSEHTKPLLQGSWVHSLGIWHARTQVDLIGRKSRAGRAWRPRVVYAAAGRDFHMVNTPERPCDSSQTWYQNHRRALTDAGSSRLIRQKHMQLEICTFVPRPRHIRPLHLYTFPFFGSFERVRERRAHLLNSFEEHKSQMQNARGAWIIGVKWSLAVPRKWIARADGADEATIERVWVEPGAAVQANLSPWALLLPPNCLIASITAKLAHSRDVCALCTPQSVATQDLVSGWHTKSGLYLRIANIVSFLYIILHINEAEMSSINYKL